jgi:hypothetical protein
MIEVICAGSLFLSTNACLDSTSLDLVSLDTTKSTLIQSNIGQNEIYLAGNESDYSRELEQLMDRFNIIIQDSPSQNSDFDADERRRELEIENGQDDSEDNSTDEQESDYRRQADEARDGYDTNVPDSDSESDNSDSDNFDADERRRELEESR